ncbi:hypothetical protein [Paenibacillus alvei]|uniref:Uncharacterized protein n=1 Tax=Paenibacillus alvei TaxID=44250 RepID=A0AAP7A2A6_PAEAL|nr:hypothetical protein [Paenibacillus alvei]NOJ71548.1 hypothetical protein [Paenibacillus alvei]
MNQRNTKKTGDRKCCDSPVFFDVPRKRNRRPRLNLAEYGGLGAGLLHKIPDLVHVRTNIATKKDRNSSSFCWAVLCFIYNILNFLSESEVNYSYEK